MLGYLNPLVYEKPKIAVWQIITNALLDIPAGSLPLTVGAELDAMLLSI
jgi:hypothetical protein